MIYFKVKEDSRQGKAFAQYIKTLPFVEEVSPSDIPNAETVRAIKDAKSKAEAEIKLLKGQLHPHFLFNSLNNIYSLALVKSDLTADSILKLTELLDYLVYKANMDKVPLSKEVQLLHNYIGLEQLRYGNHLRIETAITVQNDALLVAPLLLLPFAENCFKHGGPGQDG